MNIYNCYYMTNLCVQTSQFIINERFDVASSSINKSTCLYAYIGHIITIVYFNLLIIE